MRVKINISIKETATSAKNNLRVIKVANSKNLSESEIFAATANLWVSKPSTCVWKIWKTNENMKIERRKKLHKFYFSDKSCKQFEMKAKHFWVHDTSENLWKAGKFRNINCHSFCDVKIEFPLSILIKTVHSTPSQRSLPIFHTLKLEWKLPSSAIFKQRNFRFNYVIFLSFGEWITGYFTSSFSNFSPLVWTRFSRRRSRNRENFHRTTKPEILLKIIFQLRQISFAFLRSRCSYLRKRAREPTIKAAINFRPHESPLPSILRRLGGIYGRGMPAYRHLRQTVVFFQLKTKLLKGCDIEMLRRAHAIVASGFEEAKNYFHLASATSWAVNKSERKWNSLAKAKKTSFHDCTAISTPPDECRQWNVFLNSTSDFHKPRLENS